MTDKPTADKPMPIDLRPYQEMIGGSREFLRIWRKEDGPITCFINPVPVGADPAGFGFALVDAIRHAAKTWNKATGIPEEEALTRIWEGVDAGRANPADLGAQIVHDEDMN